MYAAVRAIVNGRGSEEAEGKSGIMRALRGREGRAPPSSDAMASRVGSGSAESWSMRSAMVSGVEVIVSSGDWEEI